MNYRHAYHAGNFADVLKHAILARIVMYLRLKPQPFRVVDTHAGVGLYDLESIQAQKTGEWRDGIARLLRADLSVETQAFLRPYLDVVRDLNPNAAAGAIKSYPGSPFLAHRLMRDVDTLLANELHPEDAAQLKSVFARQSNCTVMSRDAWQVLKAALPPTERRGLVLIDPPFEQATEFADLSDGLGQALKRFPNGVYLIWYPLKNVAAAETFVANATAAPGCKFLDARLSISAPFPGLGLVASGVLVLNPPYTLKSELEHVLPELTGVLREGKGAEFSINAGEG